MTLSHLEKINILTLCEFAVEYLENCKINKYDHGTMLTVAEAKDLLARLKQEFFGDQKKMKP